MKKFIILFFILISNRIFSQDSIQLVKSGKEIYLSTHLTRKSCVTLYFYNIYGTLKFQRDIEEYNDVKYIIEIPKEIIDKRLVLLVSVNDELAYIKSFEK